MRAYSKCNCVFSCLFALPEDTSDHKQAAHTERHAAMFPCLVAGCKCTFRTLAAIRSPLGELRHPPHTPAEGEGAETRRFRQSEARVRRTSATRRGHSHFVRLTACFCAAAVVGGRGRDETSGAGVCRVLAVARALKGIAATCLLRRQSAVCGTYRGRLLAALLLFAD